MIDQKGLADIIDGVARCRAEHPSDMAFLDNPEEIAQTVLSTLSLGTRIRLADGTEAVVVPVEPSLPMQIAGRDAMLAEDDELDLSTDDALAAYRAMVSALETK